VIRRHLEDELPFMATETILMQAVRRGGDRQELHERIRRHSMAAAEGVKERGERNDLVQRIAGDSAFGMSRDEIDGLLDPARFTGRAAEQVEIFLRDEVGPVLALYEEGEAVPELRA
jgi:adenylosuccinate lyase